MRIFFLICLSAALLFAVACGTHSAAGINVNPEFGKLVAPDTKLLAGVDLDSLKSSPFYKSHEKDLNFSVFNTMAERVGVNPLRDVSSVMGTWNGKIWLIVERGRFNAKDVQNRLIASGTPQTTYDGHTLFGTGGTQLVLFKNLAVEGPQASLHRAIDLEANSGGDIPKELQDKLQTLARRDQIWAVSRGGLAFADLPMNSDWRTNLSNITASVSGTTAGVYLDSGLHVSIDIQCVSDQGATRVDDAIRGIVGFARLSTKDNEEDLLRAYDAIQVNKTNEVVQVRADLPEELANKLIGSLTSLRRGN